jgi:hypothetical protein
VCVFERALLLCAAARTLDARLPGKGNSNSLRARPVHLIITMIKWTRTSRLSIKCPLVPRAIECPRRKRMPEVQDSGFGIQGSRFGIRVPDLGIRDSGFRFRDSRSKFRDSGTGFQDLGSGIRGSGSEFRDSGFLGVSVHQILSSTARNFTRKTLVIDDHDDVSRRRARFWEVHQNVHENFDVTFSTNMWI